MSTTDTTPTPVKTTVTGLTPREVVSLRKTLRLARLKSGGMELTHSTVTFFERTPEQAAALLRKRQRQFGLGTQHRAGLQSVIDRLTPLREDVFEQPPTEGRTMSEQVNEMADDLPQLIEQLAASAQTAQLVAIHELVNISLVTTNAAIELTKALRENNPDDQWIAQLGTQLQALSEHTDHLQENMKEFIADEGTDDSK